MKSLSSFIHTFTFLCLTFSLFTCKQTDLLPQATQEGKNTFGCLINGKAYIPDGGNGFLPPKPVNGGFTVSYGAKRLSIFVRVYAKDNRRVQIYVDDYVVGRYLLNSDTRTQPASLEPKSYGLYISPEGDEYVTSSKYTGQVTILKADTTTGVISGSFYFKAYTPTGQTVSISDGRFDVNNRTQ
jgi:DNA-binding beta-propeller fold protein YncE